MVVRAVQEDELDEMLAVMCEAFEIDVASARRIFLSDPYFHLERKRVLVVEGRIVSCLTIVDASLRIGESFIKVAGIAGVATRRDARNLGHAEALIRSTLDHLHATGYDAAALVTNIPAYYEKMGFVTCSNAFRFTFPTRLIPPYLESRSVRPATHEDLPAFLDLYTETIGRRTGSAARDPNRWRYLLQHSKNRIIYSGEAGPEGYMLYEMRTAESLGFVRIMEIAFTTKDAERGLLGYFSGREQTPLIEISAPPTTLRESLLVKLADESPDGEEARLQPDNGLMLKILRFDSALKELCQRARLTGMDIEYVIGAEAIHVRGGANKDSFELAGAPTAWTQLLTGFVGLEMALEEGLVVSRDHALCSSLSPLLPERDPFLPLPDHF